MRHDETRDNTTAIEANLSEADAREETREDGPTWDECECGACTEFNEAEAEYIRNSRHIRLVEERHPEHNDGANGYDEDEPEDDGQPSEYEEWQDYMGGDEYYDHSENACW